MNSREDSTALLRLVVVGGGTAGAEVAFATRSAGWEGEIVVLSDELYPPYHRPPLSKDMLTAESTFVTPDPIRGESLYAKRHIDLRLGVSVKRIDRRARYLHLNGGGGLSYDRVVLAVGGCARDLHLVASAGGHRPSNVHTLRTLDDCARLRTSFQTGRVLMVVGAGYIGLEVAAAAVKAGQRVIVLEAAPRVLARVTAPVVSRFFEREHARRGVEIYTSTTIDRVRLGCDERVARVWTSDGAQHAVDNMAIGIGLTPNIDIAQNAGLAIANGIVVDNTSTTP